MAYIGETIRSKAEYVTEGGIGLITLPASENATLMFDTDYTDKIFKFINVNTTLTLVSTNNYYVAGTIEVNPDAIWDVGGTGVLTII